jgi:Putative Actinobacterial Holin-X, holin superfamily III
MATETAPARENTIAELLSELSQESAGLVREELKLMREELADQGRRVATSAALLGGAGVLGLGAFGALTTAAISAIGRRHTTRGALLVAALYGASAGALAETGVRRLGRVAPEAVGTLQRDVKAAASGVRRAA